MDAFFGVIGVFLFIFAVIVSLIWGFAKLIKNNPPIKGKTVAILYGVSIVLVSIGLALPSSGDSTSESPTEQSTKIVAETSMEATTEKKTESTTQKKTSTSKEKKKIKVKTTEEEKTDTECEYANTTLKFLESKITKDDFDDEVLVLYFEFTNNSKENKAYIYTYDTKIFQNGVEIENGYVHVGQETRNADAEIQPGTTVTVAESFDFKGNHSPITVEVEPWVSFTDKKLMKFDINF